MDSAAIWIVKNTLTDGSEVFAVEIGGDKFDCITEQDATDFADAFQELVEKHTNIEVAVMPVVEED